MVPADNRFTLLNVVVFEIRSISDTRAVNSSCSALRCESLTVPVADCDESSERRARISPDLPSAFSPMLMALMPSFAFRTAWVAIRTSARSRSAMARPAASSAALLMRRPDARRSSDLLRLLLEDSRCR